MWSDDYNRVQICILKNYALAHKYIHKENMLITLNVNEKIQNNIFHIISIWLPLMIALMNIDEYL